MKTKNLSESELADLKIRANRILADCRTTLLNQQPFVGTVAMNLGLKAIRDRRCETACTDGKTVYFDIDFLSRLNKQERVFVIAHEVWHNVMLHFARLENRDRQLFNIATDMEVNQLLIQDGMTAPKSAVLPKDYNLDDGLNAEEYYDLLRQMGRNLREQKNRQAGADGDGSNGGEPGETLDKHVYAGDENPEESKNRTDKYGEVGYDGEFQPRAEKTQVEQVREMIASAVMQVERSRGEIPGCVKKLIDKLLNPEIPWTEKLASTVSTAAENRKTWNTPNRRFAWSGTYLPTHTGEHISVAVGIDTSGSVCDCVQRFLSELNGIAKSFDSYDIHVIQCDADVKKYEHFTEENPLDVENNGFEFEGFGGTRLHPVMDYIAEHDIDVDTLVMLTDGECERFELKDQPAYGVLWTLTNENNDGNFEFGDIAHLKDAR